MIARRVHGLLRIRPGEERTAFRLLALMLVAMAGAAVGANGVESLFFSRFGPDFLPYLYLALGPITFAVMTGTGSRLSGEAIRLLVRLPLVLAAAVLVARGILELDLRWFYPVLWLVMMVLWVTQLMGSWGLAGAVSDTRQAKRLFPLYGAGLIAGAVIGGLATGPLADAVHADNLLFVWAGALFAAHVLARSLAGPSKANVRSRRRPDRVGLIGGIRQGLGDVLAWPLLRWMSLSLILLAALYFTLALLFAEAATARLPSTDDLAGFLGLFMGATNGAALLVSLVIAPRLFARFGLPAMVLVLAGIYLAGYGALALMPTFGALVAFRFVQMVWFNGVWTTAWQALFNVVPAERRARTRSFMDAGPLQAGVMLSGLLLILADRVLARSHLYVVGAVAASVALWSMWRARRAYGEALMEALRSGNPDVFRPEEEPFGGFRDDADAYAAVAAGASDPDPALRRISMEILADVADAGSASVMVPKLVDPDPAVRTAAVRGLVRTGAARDAIRTVLDDSDPGVRAHAAGGLLPDAEAHSVLVGMCRDGRPPWRAAAMEALGGESGDLEVVAAGLNDPDPSVRRAAARALAVAHQPVSVDLLINALRDGDESVRKTVADALGAVGPPAEDALVRALSDPDLQVGAVEALTVIPGPAPEALLGYARDQGQLARHYHRLWLAARPGDDEPMQLLAHGARSRALEHGFNALRAGGRRGNPEAIAMAVENLSSPDPQQRANALETLEAVGDPEVVRPLLVLWDAPPDTRVAVASPIAEFLDDADPWLRACAALAAGSVSDIDLAPVAALAASDPDPLVREAATVTLKGGTLKTLSTLSLLERVMFLRKVPLFEELSPADLKHIAEVASEHAYPDGEVIAEQGEPGDEMHIVVSGQIGVMRADDGSHPAEIARRFPGEYVGEMAIISDEPRLASLVCSGAVRTLSLDRRRFERILRERPAASLAVMRVLCDRLRESHRMGGMSLPRGHP
jgi:HEAT repeat protein